MVPSLRAKATGAAAAPDKLYRRERQLIAEASAKACAMGAFSISFVAKKTTVKAIIYLQQPSYATARAADVPQELDDELDDSVVDVPAPPAPAAAPQRPPPRPTPAPARSTPPQPPPTTSLATRAPEGDRGAKIARPRPAKARVNKNALSACGGGGGSGRVSPTSSTSTTATLQPAAKVPRAAAVAGPQMSADEESGSDDSDGILSSDDDRSVPTSMMWIRRAVDEGRLRRTLPTDMREWSEGDRRAFQAAYAFECESGRGRPPMPQPWHLQAILGTRDLRPP